MIEFIGNRQTALEERIPPLIEHAVKAYLAGAALTEDERRWIKAAIQAQGERAELRKAVIEKTLSGLIWSAIVTMGYALWVYLKNELRRGG